MVAAGQCWHWFDRLRVAAGARRLPVPGGALLTCHLGYLALPGKRMLSRRSARPGTQPSLEHGRPDRHLPGLDRRCSRGRLAGLEMFSLCLGQLLELLGEEPPVCFCRCEVGGACESGLRGVWSS